MPGNICAHTHFYGAFARGMAIPGAAPKDFPEILDKLWWPLDKALQPKDVYYSALVCLIDAVRHGTTTLIDHHASPNAIAGSLDEITRAVQESGLRVALCYEVTDRDGPEKAQAGIDENLRFIQRVRQTNGDSGMLGATFGLHASLTLTDETLAACRECVPDGVGFHVHVAEHSVDEYNSLGKSGLRVVDRLHKFGILGPETIAVHCVHVDAREIALLAETGTWVSHQPRSNMNNGVGLPAVESMLRAGVRVCLGNDGFSNAMWQEWKTTYLAHKLINLDPRRMSALDIVRMAVVNNAALAERLLPGAPLGVLQTGARADLIFVDYQPYTPLTAGNLPWHIVFGFHESMVTTTMVNGKLLMHNRQLLMLDEARIAAEARRLAPQIWERYSQNIAQVS
jgi:putative selenium metabolism protein SsnA